MKTLSILILVMLVFSCHHKGIIQPIVIDGLIAPSNGDTLHTPFPQFIWGAEGDAEAYHVQVDDRETFASPVLEDTSAQDTVFTCPDSLGEDIYYWRVRAKTQGYWGEWSEASLFHIVLNPYHIVGHIQVSGYARALLVDGHHAYIAAGEGCLSVVDISVPEAPMEVATGDVVGQHLAVNLGKLPGDSILIIADSYQMIKIFNVSDPLDPEFVGDGQVWIRYVRDVKLQARGDTILVYIATRDNGLRVHDNSDPSYPNFLAERGSALLPGASNGLFPSGNFAFVANGELGLQVVEVSDSIFVAAAEDTPGYAEDVHVQGDLAYIADGYSGLSIIDISDPYAPGVLSSLDVPGYQQGVSALGSRVFLAGSEGFYVVDATDPANPSVFGRVETEYGYDVFADESYIYLADRSGLYVIGMYDW
jgi:hypothetical protein